MLTTAAEADILKRVIRPEQGGISPDVAKELLKLDFPESDHVRMTDLSAKAGAGTLSQSEQEELDGYINVSRFIAFVQSKARVSLKSANPNSSAA
ncbi:MAG: hypothetical protein JWO87_2459 [Phycisphaerales bacterium]|nr:hypothetical protein [Phycisphaerales bacterium]